jgi:hypothetical protein
MWISMNPFPGPKTSPSNKESLMKKNLGTMDRIFRAFGGVAMLAGTVVAPLSLAVRIVGFATMGTYLLLTSAVGSCFGYTLMGKSTAPVEPTQ